MARPARPSMPCPPLAPVAACRKAIFWPAARGGSRSGSITPLGSVTPGASHVHTVASSLSGFLPDAARILFRMSERHRFGLSTSWNGGRQSRASDLLDEHARLGFRRLEAYALHTPESLTSLGREARERDFEITSLHAPCPIAVDERGNRARWGDWLASTNTTDRTFAVDTVRRTIDAAAELGARGIVIHLGTTSMSWTRTRAVADAITREGRNSEAHLKLVEQVRAEREANKGPH